MNIVEPTHLRRRSDLSGVVLVDSLVFLCRDTGSAFECINCLQWLVDAIYDVTSVAVSAVALQEASFGGEHGTYQAMLAYLLEQKEEFAWPYEFLLVISTGNDIYDQGFNVLSFERYVSDSAQRAETGIREFLSEAADQFTGIGLVFGGSSDVWHYVGVKARVYDRVVYEVLTSSTMNSLQYVSSGETALLTLDEDDIVDCIGRVDVRAYAKLELAVVSWIREITDEICPASE